MLLKPDTLNGQKVFRGVEQVSGVNHQNSMVLFAPTVHAPHGPVKTLAELTAEAQSKISIIGSDPRAQVSVSATVGKIEKMLRKLVAFWMRRAALNERERIRLALQKHGMQEAQHAMMDGAD